MAGPMGSRLGARGEFLMPQTQMTATRAEDTRFEMRSALELERMSASSTSRKVLMPAIVEGHSSSSCGR
jgi:hypothetical protein